MRILVIEDDPYISKRLVSSLEAESFIVDTAAEGERGSYIARTNDYDLIILDLILPKKDGAEICRDIRAAGKTVPILMLSINNLTERKVELLNYGADDYLAKPFSFQELMARIRALLRRPVGIQGEIMTIDDLTVDSAKQRAYRSGKEIYLTRKEFALLELLLRNKGNVVSRGMILEHVWSSDTDPFSNTIEAHILNIRRKIDSPRRSKLIQTVPGRGYKIELEDARKKDKKAS